MSLVAQALELALRCLLLAVVLERLIRSLTPMAWLPYPDLELMAVGTGLEQQRMKLMQGQEQQWWTH